MSNTDSQPEILPIERMQISDPSARSSSVRTLSAYSHSGPLPPAQEFADYEEALTGAADRILTLAEKQAEHRMKMEEAVVFGGIAQMRWGLVCATVVVLATLGVTAYTASLKQGLWGLAAVFAEITAIAGAFVYSTKKNTEERSRKQAIRKHQPKEAPKDSPRQIDPSSGDV